jgi:RNA binding exosome subunit
MKSFHHVAISVFAKPEDDAPKLAQGLRALLPFSLDDEQLTLEDHHAKGFNERTIHIMSVHLMKDRHINTFLDSFLQRLSRQQRLQLMQEADTRLDSELMFFIRIDKDLWANEQIVQLTDSGNCYHFKCHVSAFPSKREVALDVVTKVFKPD